MEVRFIFLHPPSTEEILFATPVIRRVVKQVEHAEVIAAVPEGYEWLLEDNPYVSAQIVYNRFPSNNITEFRGVRADYLIDLSGERTAWFKNRLGVMDFSLKKKIRIKINAQDSKKASFEEFKKEVYQLLNVFDLEADGDGLDFFYGHNKGFVEKAVPPSFLGGYAMLDMPDYYREDIDITGPLSELISRIERPVVLNGKKEWRACGEEVMRRTGCTILSTCGDFNEKEQVYIRAGAKVLINIEPGREIWSMVFNKEHFYFNLSDNPGAWSESVDAIRRILKMKE